MTMTTTITTITTTTTTSLGRLRGAVDDGVVVFRGIPYAQPPIGPLRFAPPQRLEPWSEVRSAERFGPAPLQTAAAALSERLVGETDEDCLSLNVWTPALDDRRRPVLVWFHGGAWLTGAGSSYNGAVLARRGDLVVVTVNYRLGLFGWLRGIDVCGESLPSTGNNGLYDQLAALEWVRDGIAAFGGDRANVTVFGQSAGAISIVAMLTVPRARGLFHKAILQSGRPWRSVIASPTGRPSWARPASACSCCRRCRSIYARKGPAWSRSWRTRRPWCSRRHRRSRRPTRRRSRAARRPRLPESAHPLKPLFGRGR